MHERERMHRPGPPFRHAATSHAADPRVARILALQRSAGNHAVARMFYPEATDEEQQAWVEKQKQTWSIGSYFDPWQYLPTALGGYTDRQAKATQNPDPNFHSEFPKDAAWAFRLAFLIVDEAKDKKRPDDLTRKEYDETATLIGEIWRGATGLGISRNLDPTVTGGSDAGRYLKLMTETLKDIIEIARTVMGRQLLTEVAHAAKDVRVTIETNEFVEAPTAGEMNKGIPLNTPQKGVVKYTPTAYKAGLAKNYAANLKKQEQLKQHNPWLLPHRADVSLLHELIHAFHLQKATTKAKERLVDNTAVHEVDSLFMEKSPFGELKAAGVRVEEYATVGLGAYRNDRFTENRYRAERRSMGEDVPDRDYYTVKDVHGQRLREHVGL